MARLEGKVAFITGAARGQGRAHALRLAEEGADIVVCDICRDVASVGYPLGTEEELSETARLVEDLDQRVVSRQADVRDGEQLAAVVEEGISEFGRIDIVCANAGIATFGPSWELSEETWQDMIDTNLTGVWETCRAVIPHMIERGEGGSIIITSSTAGIMGLANVGHYVAAKHGVVGLMKTLANELAPHMIRVNTVHPTSVDTPMIHNETTYGLFMPHLESPTREDAAGAFATLNALPIPWVEARDISNAVLWLASDDARYVTGQQLKVDAGSTEKVG
ncbi:oxidoreductase, SDR family [Rubrobacter radiotolerans]|uniref:Mycofactocin-coupled SDR family oxidoreductase n=1 Tax=Rubrobacter radiotolerans TaxID=42256 RepID=A0A023X4K5_RUBRA|nr:mycofactocin-coupled SDR family oxidoreductase [Rubrobacter radiotolerans]AHY46984.1 oxidoreductase, SDR family [Rubrobacter radiotolerans]MDX5894390.1 mycofactocin-coupled SDR family oxidoreductase [Rubrobacter radiotolerans]SMC05889.1 SDR family mycofactocin-dependent oxidoreductase [Rubrobacter radiotolerans DSM 5868]